MTKYNWPEIYCDIAQRLDGGEALLDYDLRQLLLAREMPESTIPALIGMMINGGFRMKTKVDLRVEHLGKNRVYLGPDHPWGIIEQSLVRSRLEYLPSEERKPVPKRLFPR